MEEQQSQFNMALAYLERLNTLLYLTDQAAMQLDVHKWYHTQLALFRELSTEIPEKEITQTDQKYEKILPQVQRQQQKNMTTGKKSINPQLYQQLHQQELYLRKILKKSGLQMKMKQSPTEAIEGL